jgi:hypothetical protein
MDTPDIGPCTLWQGATDADGYGILKVKGKMWRAHRYLYQQARGPIPDGMVVMHRCDNPSCIRLDHLQLGTQAENLADMRAKGRAVTRRAQEHGQAKLTNAQVRAIRLAKGVPYKHLAQQYHVSPATIASIRARRGWQNGA